MHLLLSAASGPLAWLPLYCSGPGCGDMWLEGLAGWTITFIVAPMASLLSGAFADLFWRAVTTREPAAVPKDVPR